MKKQKKEKVVLIDGSAFAYRSFFAFIKNPLRNSKGENTSAIFGVTNSLFKILREQEFTHIAVCFDTPQPTFRHEIYAEYKATREKMPDELSEQIPPIKEMIEALGISLLEVEGFEADDVIGTLTREALSKNYSVTLITFDKDFYQLLDDDAIDILKPARGKISEEIITRKDVQEKIGVPPEKVTDFLALVGDTSDNVPGVPGIGPKTAVKLLERFENINGIIEKRGKIKSKKMREGIDEEQLALSKDLVTIRTDVDIGVTVDSLKYRGRDGERLKELLVKFEFSSLMGEEEQSHEKEIDVKEISLSELKRVMRRIKGTVACEFLTLDGKTLFVFGSAERIFLCEIESDRTREKEVFDPLLKDDKILKITCNSKSLLHLLGGEENSTKKGFCDLSIASYLLDPSRGSHGIDFVSLRFANRTVRKKSDLVKEFGKKKIGMEEVKQELCRFVQTDLTTHPVIHSRLKKEKVMDLFTSLEMPLVSVLARIEKVGILLDRKLFERMSERYGKEIEEIEKDIYSLAGEKFNVRSTKQLQHILYDKLRLKPPRRTKTGYSTDSDSLLILSEEHELPKELLKYRELYKLKSTYIDTLPNLVDSNGRIHTTLIQTTTATGRLASRNPNLQNIPVRAGQGKEIRKGFIAPEGKSLLSCDYSQIELRVLAHVSNDENLKDAFYHDVDIHRRTASRIFRIPEEDITSEMRRKAKVVNFGIIYGMSPFGLAQELNIKPEEGGVIIDTYFNTYPEVKEWIDSIIDQTEERGYTETLMGRKRTIPELQSKNRNTREFGKRIAINTPIQGSAADIIKKAMIDIDEELRKGSIDAKMILQIHDELLFEVGENHVEDAQRLIVGKMEKAADLSVPLKVDVGVGKNWFEAH
jgi:DNA polymerase-1